MPKWWEPYSSAFGLADSLRPDFDANSCQPWIFSCRPCGCLTSPENIPCLGESAIFTPTHGGFYCVWCTSDQVDLEEGDVRRGLRVCKATQFNELVKNRNFGGSLVFPGDVLLLPRAYSVMIYGIQRGEDDPQPSFGAWWPMLHKDAFDTPVEQQAASSLAARASF